MFHVVKLEFGNFAHSQELFSFLSLERCKRFKLPRQQKDYLRFFQKVGSFWKKTWDYYAETCVRRSSCNSKYVKQPFYSKKGNFIRKCRSMTIQFWLWKWRFRSFWFSAEYYFVKIHTFLSHLVVQLHHALHFRRSPLFLLFFVSNSSIRIKLFYRIRFLRDLTEVEKQCR